MGETLNSSNEGTSHRWGAFLVGVTDPLSTILVVEKTLITQIVVFFALSNAC